MRTPVDRLITAASLRAISVNDCILDLVAEDQLPHDIQLKNVCAKVSVELSNEIDNICDMLDIRKRRFLEAAMIEAIAKAHAIIEAEGVHEHYQAMHDHHEAVRADQERARGAE